MPEQLILPFEVRAARDRADFVVAPCNEAAVRFVDRWPEWPVLAAALYGPAGSGKSHLLQVWQTCSNAVTVAADDLRVDMRADAPVAIDDVDRAPTIERDRALMALFDGRSQMLLTGTHHPAEWPVIIPDLKSRFAALAAFPLWAPDDALLRDLARKLFADRQLDVSPGVIARMLGRLPRTPDAVRGFVERLDRYALAGRRAINERLVGELLEREGI